MPLNKCRKGESDGIAVVLPCSLETKMVIEELKDPFEFSYPWRRGGGVGSRLDQNASGLPVLVRQVVGSHDLLKQFIACDMDLYACELCYEPERAKG